MANKRNKKKSSSKLSSKQANTISLIISAIYFICVFVRGMILDQTGEDALFYWIACCFVGTGFIFFIFYYFIFNVETIKTEENRKKIEIENIQHLSYTEFKQIYFIKNPENDIVDMMKQIMQKEECKFYAKLTNKKNIYLIVKDKHNEEVYSREIQNHFYFNSNFRFKE